MKETPFVSVVIPCYNAQAYIRSAVESMLAQTRDPDEIVVVDDCSTDDSWHILEALAREHGTVRVFRNEINQGIPTTRNRLITEMSPHANYMAILDADDVAEETRIEKQLAYMTTHPDCGLLGSDTAVIDDEDTQIGIREYPHEHQAIVSSALHFNPFAQSSVMVRTAVFERVGIYDERLARVQDYDLWLRIILAGYQVNNLAEPLTLFRRHKDQGKETMAQKSIYYSWRVRARYIWRPQFFSLKGFALFGAYTLAMIVPKNMLNKLYAKLFVKKHDKE